MNRRHATDAAWIVGGQGAAALGSLVGVRLLTELLPPAVFGTLSLALGAIALVTGVICTPLTQAAMHFHPQFAASHDAGALQVGLFRALRKAAAWCLPPMAVVTVACAVLGSGSFWIVAAGVGLLVFECGRSAALALYNAARRHRRYSLWVAADAWAKPLAAVGFTMAMGASAGAAVAAYGVASALLLVLFQDRSAAPPEPAGPAGESLDRRLWQYALPLVPLGLIGWANGLGDRYLIGGVLGIAEAGVYAAAYGLASRPLLLLGGCIELLVRPAYQAAVSAGDAVRARRLLSLWLSAGAASSALFVALVSRWDTEIAALLLGDAYRTAAPLLPWISAGYALLVVSQIFERICYAHGVTHRVLLTQACGAVVGVGATIVGILQAGLAGAAAAVPAYFGAQLVVAMFLARRTQRQAAGRAVGAVAIPTLS